MAGLVEEGEEVISEGIEKDNAIADLALIAAAQKVNIMKSPRTGPVARLRSEWNGRMWRSCSPHLVQGGTSGSTTHRGAANTR